MLSLVPTPVARPISPATIPDCPDKICVVNGQPKDCNNGQWEGIEEADQRYHYGAKWCMRSNTYRESGQQCCYNEQGELIRDARKGAGTPDRYAPAVLNGIYLMHYFHDVVPYYYALELDGDELGVNFDAYISVRPPNPGGGSCYK